jgi:fibronectin-binding autotransporter adhesin
MKSSSLLPSVTLCGFFSVFLFGSAASLSAQTTYEALTGGDWNDPSEWSVVSGPGTTFPNGIGDVAQRTSGGSVAMTQNVGADVTLGGALLGGGATASLTLTLSTGNGIVFDNGGAGALLQNSTGATSGRLTLSGGTVTLADDLTLSNTSTSATKTNGSISITSLIAGTGDLSINNVMNSLSSGYILMGNKNSTFVGSTTIESGAVTMSNSGNPTAGVSFFGLTSNTVTLGSTGGGSVSLVGQGYSSTVILTNQIVVAAGTGGTTVLGSNNVNAALVSGAASFTGDVALNGDVTLLSAVSAGNVAANATNTTVFSGVISGTGDLTVIGTAASLGSDNVALGTTHLTGANTFTGITRIASGTLAIGANGGGTDSLALQNSTVDLNGADSGSLVFGTTEASAGTFFPDASLTASATFGGLQGSRDLALVNYAAGAVALSVGNNNSNTTYSGALSGAGSLTKIGTGVLTLTGANSHAGGTTVNAGTLLVNGTISESAVTVNAGGTLGGTGAVAPTGANGLVVNSGGVVAPGDGGIGSLEVNLGGTTGSASFLSGSNFVFDLNAPGGSDVLDFTGLTASSGDVIFNGNVINFNDLGSLAPGLYTLMTFDADNAYTGTLAVGSGLGGYTGSFIYNADSIQLNVVPEPSVAVLLLGGFAGMACLRLRRRN